MSGNPHVDVMLAGAAAAFTVDLLIYPLDTLKTRQQSRDYLKTFADPTSSPSSSSSSSPTKRLLPPGHLFRGLYQGVGIVIVATLPASGTFFLSYEAAKRIIGDRSKKFGVPQAAVHSAASALAECASCLVLTPAEVIKQNAQMMKSNSSSSSSSGAKATAAPSSSTSLAALKQLSKGRGVTRNLLSGYTALVARNLPFTALQFPIFEYVRERIWTSRRAKQEGGGGTKSSSSSLLETGVVTGVSAGLAGSFSAIVTTPMDVVKTRMMLSAGDNSGTEGQGQRQEAKAQKSGTSSASSSKQQSNVGGFAVTRQVIAEKGIVGLFRGAVLRGVWTAVGSGLYLGMYEVSKMWLTRDEKGLEDRGFP